MNKAGKTGKKILTVIYLLAVHALALLFVFDRFVAPYLRNDDSLAAQVASPTEETPVPTIAPVPSSEPETAPATDASANSALDPVAEPNANSNLNINPPVDQNPPPAPAPSDGLMIPVRGVTAAQLTDTFADARAGGRVHDAIDIMAAGGTPVVAAANGEIAKFFDSRAGGITIYQYSPDKKYVYYYAHLQSRAAGLGEKDFVTQGAVIGYVGDTGNAGPGNFHLHFSIALLKDPNRYWEGEYVNPFPLLKNAREAR